MEHRPRKRFGQNFLKDTTVIDRILQAASLQEADRVLEIGPGLGALTDRMLPLAGQVTVMEVDRDLGSALQERNDPKLVVHVGDALRLEWKDLLPRPPYKLVANLPYNISSQILFKILDYRQLFGRLVLMFQKEVGDRLCALPATKDYGILSVLCQFYFDVKRVAAVPPGAFFPPPSVHSVVLSFDPLPHPRFTVPDDASLRKVVKGAFAQRRKTLRNTLQSAGFSSEAIKSLPAAGIDPGRRGETLTLEEFARLCRALCGGVH